MKEYKEIEITNISEEKSDLLIGLLSELGFDGFEQDGDNSIKAFINNTAYVRSALDELAREHAFAYRETIIEEQNWNTMWESNFEPILVEKFVGIRASFHAPITDTVHEVVITPKMSFGTGHHATTYMMVQRMRNLPLWDATVYDFGTGTGILAVLAEKLGAQKVLAVDNDEWSIRNAEENISANHCSKIVLQLDDKAVRDRPFDIILANINKNVIIANFADLVSDMHAGSYLILSGLLAEDEADIAALAQKYQLQHLGTTQRLQWISIAYTVATGE